MNCSRNKHVNQIHIIPISQVEIVRRGPNATHLLAVILNSSKFLDYQTIRGSSKIGMAYMENEIHSFYSSCGVNRQTDSLYLNFALL